MLDTIDPGTEITVKIVRQPTNVAAAKTLRRVLSQDPAVKAENRRLEKVRKAGMRVKQRGGRPWEVRVVKQHPVAGQLGESGTVTASADVLRDLGSVQRFIEVAPV